MPEYVREERIDRTESAVKKNVAVRANKEMGDV